MDTYRRVLARDNFKRWHLLTRPQLAKCGAKTRVTGEPCRQIAMENGKCAYHGGRTPKGAGWHKPRWPNGKAPDAEKKLARKLADRDRDAVARRKRLAAMTPEQRERHVRWQKSHVPGSAAQRAKARADRQRAAEIKGLLATARHPSIGVDERSALVLQIERLERERAAINAVESGEGIFG